MRDRRKKSISVIGTSTFKGPKYEKYDHCREFQSLSKEILHERALDKCGGKRIKELPLLSPF